MYIHLHALPHAQVGAVIVLQLVTALYAFVIARSVDRFDSRINGLQFFAEVSRA